ncbi:MAG: YicC family protein, partial [Clostridia bacterium]|nr:YicC family protein [Clostridia bacterium]
MMKSMTAFGRFQLETPEREITVEIRSVNNRFLDASVRIPRRYDIPEERIKSYLKESGISRGKVDLSISVNEVDDKGSAIVLDEDYLEAYLKV